MLLEQQHAKVPQREAIGPGSALLYRGEELAVDWQEKAPRRAVRVADHVALVAHDATHLESRRPRAIGEGPGRVRPTATARPPRPPERS